MKPILVNKAIRSVRKLKYILYFTLAMSGSFNMVRLASKIWPYSKLLSDILSGKGILSFILAFIGANMSQFMVVYLYFPSKRRIEKIANTS